MSNIEEVRPLVENSLPPEETQALYDLERAIERVNDLGHPDEIVDGLTLRFINPVIFGRLLMDNLAEADCNPDGFTPEEKVFWMAVMQEIGPDWVAKFRRIGAFMAAIDKA